MIDVVGVPAAGLAELPEAMRELVAAAPVVVGDARHLAMLPDGVRGVSLPAPLGPGLAECGDDVVVLTTGDPLLSEEVPALVAALGPTRIRVHPAVSWEALARARMLWPAETTSWVSLVGRDPRRVLALAAPNERLIALAADQNTPGELARILTADGWGPSPMTVLANLGQADESRHATTAEQLAADPVAVPRSNVVAIEFRTDEAFIPRGPLLPDHAFHNDGQLTKQPIRLLALAALAPRPGDVLWDIGTGSGSIGISWLRAADRTRAVGFEKRQDRAARARSNAARLGVGDRFEVMVGNATELMALETLPSPDAIFFGGGANTTTVQIALDLLPTGGRLVVHSVTLETEALLANLHARHGGELTRISFETATALGAYRGWQPARAITCYALTKDGQ